MSSDEKVLDFPRVEGTSEFAHAQFNAFSGQAKGLSEAYTKTAADAVSKPFKKVA